MKYFEIWHHVNDSTTYIQNSEFRAKFKIEVGELYGCMIKRTILIGDNLFMIFEYAFISRSYIIVLRTICVRKFFCWFVWRKRQKNNHWSSFSYIWRSFFFFKPTFLLFNIFKKILFFSCSRSSDIQCHATFRLIRDKIFLVLYW